MRWRYLLALAAAAACAAVAAGARELVSTARGGPGAAARARYFCASGDACRGGHPALRRPHRTGCRAPLACGTQCRTAAAGGGRQQRALGCFARHLRNSSQQGIAAARTQPEPLARDLTHRAGDRIRVAGSQLVDESGQPLKLHGINWFGFK